MSKYEYIVIMEKDNYALVKRGTKHPEYAVVADLVPESEREYEGSDWGRTVSYAGQDASGLLAMVDMFRKKTEDDYISRARLEELATLFKDGLMADDEESAMEYFADTCEMEQNEMEFFGINESED